MNDPTPPRRSDPDPARDTDAEIVAGLKRGDMTAFDGLYQAHVETIYNYLYRRTANPHDAADATSSVFVQAWQARDRAITVDGSALPWLYRIALNTANNQRRTHQRHERKRHLRAIPEPDHADAVVAHLDDQRRIQWVNQQLEAMPAGHTAAFHLVIWEGLTYQQAAAVLDIPVGTVRSRISRIRSALTAAEQRPGAPAIHPSHQEAHHA